MITAEFNGYIIKRVTSTSSNLHRSVAKPKFKRMSAFTPNVSVCQGHQQSVDDGQTEQHPKQHEFTTLEEMIRRYRKWYHTTLGKAYENCDSLNQNGEFIFKMMSYNILAQELLTTHKYLYHDHDQTALNWPYRFKRLMCEISETKPDILCLQEVQKTNLDQIIQGLQSTINLKYSFVYKKRTGDKPDGCAIFYNKDAFNLIDQWNVEYEQPGIEVSLSCNYFSFKNLWVHIFLLFSLIKKANKSFDNKVVLMRVFVCVGRNQVIDKNARKCFRTLLKFKFGENSMQT